jgi:2'-5' RNA ligase
VVTVHPNLPDPPALRDHWWPRPGWRPGRIAVTWHLTFEDMAALAGHVAAYQRALADLPGLNPVPARWLHLTVQAVGYSDEVPAPVVAAVVESVRARVADLPGFALVFDRPEIFGEAIAIRITPEEPVQSLRTAIRAGIGDTLGDDAVTTAPEQAHGFVPHVTVAYSHVEADAAPYAAALAAVVTPSVSVPVTDVALIRQERQLAPHWLYCWRTEATAPLGSTPTPS